MQQNRIQYNGGEYNRVEEAHVIYFYFSVYINSKIQSRAQFFFNFHVVTGFLPKAIVCAACSRSPGKTIVLFIYLFICLFVYLNICYFFLNLAIIMFFFTYLSISLLINLLNDFYPLTYFYIYTLCKRGIQLFIFMQLFTC